MSMTVGNIAKVWVAPDASLTRPANTTAYAANQVIGNATTSLYTWTNFFPDSGSYTGLLTGMMLYSSVASIATSNLGAITAYLYNTTPSYEPLADQQTFQTLVADPPGNLIATVTFSNYTIGGASSTFIYGYGVPGLSPHPIVSNIKGKKNLYCVLAATAAFTPASAQIITPYVSAIFD